MVAGCSERGRLVGSHPRSTLLALVRSPGMVASTAGSCSHIGRASRSSIREPRSWGGCPHHSCQSSQNLGDSSEHGELVYSHPQTGRGVLRLWDRGLLGGNPRRGPPRLGRGHLRRVEVHAIGVPRYWAGVSELDASPGYQSSCSHG